MIVSKRFFLSILFFWSTILSFSCSSENEREIIRDYYFRSQCVKKNNSFEGKLSKELIEVTDFPVPEFISHHKLYYAFEKGDDRFGSVMCLGLLNPLKALDLTENDLDFVQFVKEERFHFKNDQEILRYALWFFGEVWSKTRWEFHPVDSYKEYFDEISKGMQKELIAEHIGEMVVSEPRVEKKGNLLIIEFYNQEFGALVKYKVHMVDNGLFYPSRIYRWLIAPEVFEDRLKFVM